MTMNDAFWRVQMGLRKPETAKETEAQSTLNGMRKAIVYAQRDVALIRQCLDAAYHQGLSGEDTYALLAYHALRQLEEVWQRCDQLIQLQPLPPLVIKQSDLTDQLGPES